MLFVSPDSMYTYMFSVADFAGAHTIVASTTRKSHQHVAGTKFERDLSQNI
jgi:hypothetical protein